MKTQEWQDGRREQQRELLRPGHEYLPKPKSTSDVGESYEDTGMAGRAARTAESKYYAYDGGEREKG
jgi:hypothetical protein